MECHAFTSLCYLMSRFRTLGKVGLSLPGAQCKRTTRFLMTPPPRFLGKTVTDTNCKNCSRKILKIRQILECHHIKDHPSSMNLSEPTSTHPMPFTVQSSITLPPRLKCSSRGLGRSQNSKMDVKAFQSH